jgi:hypothetical protein
VVLRARGFVRRIGERHSSDHMKLVAVARSFAALVRACLLLAGLASMATALPAFGQGARDQPISQLHQACVADAKGSLQRELHFVDTEPVDMAKFCACADAAIQKDSRFETIAASAMEHRKGAMYAPYDRALKRNPMLAGRQFLKSRFEANGRVSEVSLLSSEFDDAELKLDLIAVLQSMKLSDRPVDRLVMQVPVDFLPN